MAGTDPLVYPQAQLSMGNGDLMQVTNFAHNIDNKGKQVHTLRRTGAGVVKGKAETEVTFDYVVDEDGPEHNYIRMVQKGTIRQLRAKIPGGDVIVVNGMLTRHGLDGPLEDACKGSVRFVGHTDDK